MILYLNLNTHDVTLEYEDGLFSEAELKILETVSKDSKIKLRRQLLRSVLKSQCGETMYDYNRISFELKKDF